MSTHVLTSNLGRNSGPPSATLVRKPITLPSPLLNSWAVDLSSQIVSLDDVSTCIQLFAAIFWPPLFCNLSLGHITSDACTLAMFCRKVTTCGFRVVPALFNFHTDHAGKQEQEKAACARDERE